MGDRRIGVAASDPMGLLATPQGYIQRTRAELDITRVLEYVVEREAEAIVVGMPLSLNGRHGPQAKKVGAFVARLRARAGVPVYTMDERFSTAEAERLIRQTGRQPSRNKGQVDAAAAAVILQDYLNSQRDSS